MPAAIESQSKEDAIREVYELDFLPEPPVIRALDEMRPYMDGFVPADRTLHILDAGCGNGRWSRYLVEKGYSNLDCVDLYKQVEIPGARFQSASLDRLPFADATFDFAYSLSVVYYIDPPTRAFRELHRVLKPGAELLVTVHTKYSIFTLARIIKRFFGLKSVRHLEHCKFESVGAFRKYMEACGFEVLWIDGYRLIWESVYRRLRRSLEARRLPTLPDRRPPRITSNAFMRHYKAWCGYHAILYARKR